MVTIGMDVDGVLADFVGPYIALLNTMSAVQLPAPTADYPLCWNFAEAAHVPRSDVNAAWRHIKESDFFYNLPAMAGCRQVLTKLKKLEWELAGTIYFITARPGREAKAQTEEWLAVHGFRKPTVIIASEKGPLARSLELTHFVDDRPENCRDVAVHTLLTKVFMPAQPYNRDYDSRLVDYYRIQRVPSALDALMTLEEPLDAAA